MNVPATPSGRRPTHYEVLRLGAAATSDQIKSAYRVAARRTHPDLGGSADTFHAVALAYETLSDPVRRTAYDRSLGRAPGGSSGRASGAASGRTSGRASGSTSSRGSDGSGLRTSAPGATAEPELYRQSPLFQPPFMANPLPGEEPPLPMATAARQLHGEPRRPGLWGRRGAASAHYEGERRTVRILSSGLLPAFPAVRLVNGLLLPSGRLPVGHAVLAGYRIALVDSLRVPPGTYHWDGQVLRRDGRPAGPVRLAAAVSAAQALFPECRINGWLTLHSAADNPFEPVVDCPPSFNRDVTPVQVVNAGSLVRDLRRFLSEGPQPNVVQLSVLSRLLAFSAAPTGPS